MQSAIDVLRSSNIWTKTVGYKRGEIIKHPDCSDNRIFFIESGTLRIYFIESGIEHTIRLGYQGDIVCALDSIITGEPSPLVLQSIKSCTLFVADRMDLIQFGLDNPQYHGLWHQLLLNLIHQQMEREMDILTQSPQHRYQRVLKRSPNLFQEIPSKYIADYLRMTPETLSRIKTLDFNQE